VVSLPRKTNNYRKKILSENNAVRTASDQIAPGSDLTKAAGRNWSELVFFKELGELGSEWGLAELFTL